MIPLGRDAIQLTPWIGPRFQITDMSPINWLPYYSSTMLVGRRLPLKAVFRTSNAKSIGEIAHRKILEANPRLRPGQVAVASRLLLHASAHYAAGF